MFEVILLTMTVLVAYGGLRREWCATWRAVILDDYQTLIAASRYARWLDDEERRETFPETAKRYADYWLGKEMITDAEAKKFAKAISDLDVMPSMRAMWTAGEALDRDNAAGFNCCYTAVDHIRAFDEAFYLLMCGYGVGFSVERRTLPSSLGLPRTSTTAGRLSSCPTASRAGPVHCAGFISLLYSGHLPKWDVSFDLLGLGSRRLAVVPQGHSRWLICSSLSRTPSRARPVAS